MSLKKFVLIFAFFLLTNSCVLAGVHRTIKVHEGSGSNCEVSVMEDEYFDFGNEETSERHIQEIEFYGDLRLYFPDKNKTVNIDVEEYVTCVLTGEMYADAPTEALKAVAVAARTYTAYMCSKNSKKEYDLVADHNFSQAYVSKVDAVQAWNTLGEEKYLIMQNAVKQTEGEVLCLNNEFICALYHASSYPFTESCENIFVEDLAYLKGKESIETFENAYKSFAKYTVEEFNSLLTLFGYPRITENELYVKNYTNENSRCKFLFIKDAYNSFYISGRDVRKVFSLMSTSFDVYVKDNVINFDVYGYGHGVGLSQNGAVIMAESGKSYTDILSEYYPGTEIYKTIYRT